MATKKVTGEHPVVGKLLDALAELDKVTAADGKEQQHINQIRQKIETVTSFTAANLPKMASIKSEE